MNNPTHHSLKRRISRALKDSIEYIHHGDELDWFKDTELQLNEERTLTTEDCIIPRFSQQPNSITVTHSTGIKTTSTPDRDGWSRVLPSGKQTCRPDVTLETPIGNWAFEIKMSKSDLRNAHQQCIDYMSCGYEPVVVSPPSLFFNTRIEEWPPFSKLLCGLGGFAFIHDLGGRDAPADLIALLHVSGNSVTAVNPRLLFGPHSRVDAIKDQIEAEKIPNVDKLPSLEDFTSA